MSKTITKNTSVSYKMIWSIAYSIILGNLAQTIISLTDTAFLGRLGEVELGASAMSGIYYLFFTTLSWGFAIGVQIIVARRFGEKNYSKIGTILGHGLIFIIVFASFLFSVIHYASPIFLKKVITSPNIYNVSIDFLSYRAFGIFFASINFMYRSFYIGISKTRSISYSTIMMAVVNIALDWLLIFGSPINPAMGVAGAAIASVAAEISATIYFVVYTIVTKPIKGYKLFAKFKFEFAILKNILRLSISTTMQKFLSFGTWLIFFFIIESLGERPLAVTMVVRSIFTLIGIPAFALGAASNTLTSRLIGEGRANEVVPMIWKVVKLGLIILTPIVIFVISFPHLLISIYTDSEPIILAATPIIYQICFTVYTYCIGFVFFDAISGTGHTNSALYIEAVVLCLYVTTAWYFGIYLKADLFWIWTSEIVYGTTLMIFSILFMKYYNWQQKKV